MTDRTDSKARMASGRTELIATIDDPAVMALRKHWRHTASRDPGGGLRGAPESHRRLG